MNNTNNYFKLYPLLIALLIASQVMCFIYARRQIDILHMPVNVSELIVTSSYFLSFLTNNYSFYQTLQLLVHTVLIKSVIALLLWPVAKLVIYQIKRYEQIEGFDFRQDYKILTFAIKNDRLKLKGVYR